METTNQINLSFNGIDFINVDFKVFQPFNFEDKIDLNINAKLNHDEHSDNFQIIMEINMGVKSYFDLTIKAVGYFDINSDVSGELRNNFININAPAIMFPYVRSFITTLTSNCGNSLPTLIIPPQFFKGDLQKIEKKSD